MDHKLDECVSKLNKIPGYRQQFQKVFGTDVTTDGHRQGDRRLRADDPLGQRSLRPLQGRRQDGPSATRPAGHEDLLRQGALLRLPHRRRSFSDHSFHNIGVGMEQAKPDLGRYEVTKVARRQGVVQDADAPRNRPHAPYMHDGSIKTLGEVVDHYDKGGTHQSAARRRDLPAQAHAEEKADLVTFLKEGLSQPGLSRHCPTQTALVARNGCANSRSDHDTAHHLREPMTRMNRLDSLDALAWLACAWLGLAHRFAEDAKV